MEILTLLLENIFPLYGLIALGFVLARLTPIEMNTVASILIYVLVPVVMCGAALNMDLRASYIVPPLFVAAMSVIASGSAYILCKWFWPGDKRANLIALMNVMTNATYFGLPIAIAMAGPDSLGLYMVMILPLFVLDGSVGLYYAARGQFDPKESLIRVAKIPIVYGALLGLGLNLLGFEMPELIYTYWERFTGALVIVGMMIIGIALGQIDRFRMDYQALVVMLLTRYGLWVPLSFAFVLLDRHVLGVLDQTAYQFMVLIAACPLAANNVAYAVKFDLHPALTATLVTVTTLAALITMPLIFALADFVLQIG